MNTVAVEVKHLSKKFQIDKNKDISVLRDISFEANYGEFVSILGVSGSGKSTLLNCISSLSAPTEGVVKVNNCNPYQLKILVLFFSLITYFQLFQFWRM